MFAKPAVREEIKYEINEKIVLCPEEICCPVCEKSLALFPEIRTDGMRFNGEHGVAIRQDLRLIRNGKIKEEDLVVAALCGHLFHRFCLRHYCYVYQQSVQEVRCPKCLKGMSMVKVLPIDYRGHRKVSSTNEKDYRHTSILNQELEGQMQKEQKRYDLLQGRLKEARERYATYRGHENHLEEGANAVNRIIAEKKVLYRSIHNCNRGIDMMHKESIDIIRMYLYKIKDQSAASLQRKKIPNQLIPYLSYIIGSDQLLRKFGEILRPLDHCGKFSDIGVLIKEILHEVEPKARKAFLKKRQVNYELHNKNLNRNGNPIVVKVQKSSVTIFSSTTLEKASIQKIMQYVKKPIEILKKMDEASRKPSAKSLHRSQSEIQVILKPRKRQYSGSAPINVAAEDSGGSRIKVPARRCRSTEPILMKTTNVRKPKAIILTVEQLKQLDSNVNGDSYGKVQGEINERNGPKIDPIVTHSSAGSFETNGRTFGIRQKTSEESENIMMSKKPQIYIHNPNEFTSEVSEVVPRVIRRAKRCYQINPMGDN